jgi:ribonuclease P/MRP protein subunit POP1
MSPNPGPNNSATAEATKKRKDVPESLSGSQKAVEDSRVKRVKIQAAPPIATKRVDPALKNGELDLQSFLKSREVEIRTLEDSMRKSNAAHPVRAFQQVPRDMRRRTASHNVKRVPKRLQRRAKREMVDDNTPTVTARTRKPGSTRGRTRAETAKRLGILAQKKRAMKAASGEKETCGINTRAGRPKIRRGRLNDPPKPKSKFRKRQIHKTWLPTHLWHAKRAKMTEPKNPLWRFALPITSTEKSYRPTHRAGGTRGAVTWDMSYMSTISLQGPVESLEKVMRELGIAEHGLWDSKGEKWRSGQRSWSGWLSRESRGQRLQIGPSTIVWCTSEPDTARSGAVEKARKTPMRRLFIRFHPSAFLELWTEVLRLSKLQRPAVHVEDLRFEIGSIDITGPGSTEALLGILHPYQWPDGDALEAHGQTFTSLAGVTNPGSLPPNSLLAFSIMDPRLRYPPRTISLPPATDEDTNFALLQTLSAWPSDSHPASSALFDRDARFKATRLPSQKSLNRRKGQAPPGSYPTIVTTDPPIPIMLLASRSTARSSSQGTWTLLAPWKCILPIWYGLVHYPLSSGGNPRFGGIDEIRQIHFEHGVPWFPADYPGTNAGFAWEVDERENKLALWNKRPKGKRVQWDSLDLGSGRKGEIGRGWSCDFERIVGPLPLVDGNGPAETSQDVHQTQVEETESPVPPIKHLPTKDFISLLSNGNADLPSSSTVAAVRFTLVSRGVATRCARVYRLPIRNSSQDPSLSSSIPLTLRQRWLSLLPAKSKSKPLPKAKSKDLQAPTRIHLNTPLPQRVRLLAQSLLHTPALSYPGEKDKAEWHPPVPDEEDLIGFVTTGEFNLAEGKGVAMGTVIVAKAVEAVRHEKEVGDKAGNLCIVRNAGEKTGRLARWEAV